MKKDKFPDELYVTCTEDENSYFPICWEEIPDQNGDRIAVYKKVGEGEISVSTLIEKYKAKEKV